MLANVNPKLYFLDMSQMEIPAHLEPDEWQIAFATLEGPRSPGDAYVAVGKIARKYGLSNAEASRNLAESLELMTDPRIRESIRQMKAGEIVPITPGHPDYLSSRQTLSNKSYIEPFSLRNKQIDIVSASIYEGCHWDARMIEEISDARLTIRAIVLATRERGTLLQRPYAYINEESTPSRGIWLNETEFVVVEEIAQE